MSNPNNQQRRNPFLPQANNNTNTNNSSTTSRFGGRSRFNSRFGARTHEEVQWTIAPMTNEVVGISMLGLGDPFHRLLAMPLNPGYSDPKKVIEALSQDAELLERMIEHLDEAWANFNFRGAAMLYPWDEGIRMAYTQALQPTSPPPQKDEKNDDESFDNEDSSLPDWLDNSPVFQPAPCFRAVDITFVLNILARARSNVLVGNTPLALEAGFLDQTFICDDPRIVNLARATGSIEEVWG
jgi:hypothetical protein